MARFTIRDTEPLIINFQDGTEKVALFNNEAFILFTEEFGDIIKIMEEEIVDKRFDFAAKLLYVALKITDPKITYEEAQVIVWKGGLSLVGEIFILLIENFLSTSNEETKKKFQAMLTEEMETAIETLGIEVK